MTESDAQTVARILHGYAHDESTGKHDDAWVVRVPTSSGTLVQINDDEIRWFDDSDDAIDEDDALGCILLM